MLIFFGLGLIHFNWAIGGKFGFSTALPTNQKGEMILNPGKLDCVIVGIGLTAFGLFYIYQSGLLDHHLPEWLFTFGGWMIPSIFLLRAIGDFKYVGFFKKIKQTDFGKMDTKYFSPLCLFIGTMGIVVQFLA